MRTHNNLTTKCKTKSECGKVDLLEETMTYPAFPTIRLSPLPGLFCSNDYINTYLNGFDHQIELDVGMGNVIHKDLLTKEQALSLVKELEKCNSYEEQIIILNR